MVPNLRFAGYIDNYRTCKLIDISEIVTRTNENNSEYPIMMISAGKGFIAQSEKYSRDNAGTSINKYILLKKGELAYNRGNSKQFPYGAIYEMKEECALIPYVYHCFNIYDESTRYFSHYLNSPFKDEQLSKIITSSVRGNGLLNISKNDFFNLSLNVPSIKEQNKIAKFLDLIDQRIQTQSKIINDYKILKNHIIKSFIKQNGTSYLLSEIAELGRGRVINSAEISKQKNPIYPVYSSQTSNNGIMGYLDNYDYEGEYITWTTDGANAGTVYYRNGKFNCTNVCGILKIKNGYDAYYISNILNCYTKKYVSTNLANPKLMNNVMANIKINLPSIEQQKHSSKILQSIEYRVEIEEDIKLNLVKQKAFLLKNMFI